MVGKGYKEWYSIVVLFYHISLTKQQHNKMWTNRPYILIYNEEIFNLFPIIPLLEPYNQGR